MICTEAQKRSYKQNDRFANSKQRQMFLDRLSCRCVYEAERNTKYYRIKQVFEYPKTKAEEKLHKGIYQYLAPLILHKLLNNGTERSIFFSSINLAEDCCMVNGNYRTLKFNKQAVETDLNIPESCVSEYFAKSGSSIDYYISQCLKYLEATNCLVFHDVHLIRTYEEEYEADAESGGAILRRTYSDLRIATKEEMDLYTHMVEVASDESGVRNNCDKFYGKTSKKYRTEINRLFKANHIRFILKGFQIWKVNTNRCREIFDSFKDKTITEDQKEIGFILKSIVDNNAKQRKINDTEYLEDFMELSEITLLYDQPKIHLRSAKSYMERLQEEADNTPLRIVET